MPTETNYRYIGVTMGDYFKPTQRKLGVFMLFAAYLHLAWWGRLSIVIDMPPASDTQEYKALVSERFWKMMCCALLTVSSTLLLLSKPQVRKSPEK